MSRSIRPRRNKFPALALAVVLMLALAGCKTTPIKKLLDNPGEYEGKTVQVAGKVTATMGILNYGAFRLDDGTGTITVVTKVGGAPREGAEVGVEGVFHSAFTLGTETVAAIEETKRKSR